MINKLQRRVQEEGRKSEEEQKHIKDEEDGRREERERDLEEERERMDKDRTEKRNLQQTQKEIKRKEQEERRKRREDEMIKNDERRVEVIQFKMEEEKRKNGERIEDNLKRVDEENKVKGEEERVEMLRAEQMDEELPEWLPEPTELKRLTWMKDCPSWTKLALLNKRKPGPSVRRHRRPQRAAGAPRLPPLSPQSLLQPTGVGSLTQVNLIVNGDDGFIAL